MKPKLSLGGVLAFHISNNYIDLKPVLESEARSLGLVALVEQDDNDVDLARDGSNLQVGKYASTWAVMARSKSNFGDLRKRSPEWDDLSFNKHVPVWTDDYSNIVSALKIFEPR